jgi:very-long-chain ceramide synthase
MFVVFIVVWIPSRHVLYNMTVWSTMYASGRIIPYGCHSGAPADTLQGDYYPLPNEMTWKLIYTPFLYPQADVCWTQYVVYFFVSLLVALQCIMILWFTMIVRLAWKFINGAEAEDSRSEDEAAAEAEEEEYEYEEVLEMPVEEEVGVEAINLKSRGVSIRKSSRRGGATSASGVTLPGHSDRKELLGRIGCDKG